MQPGHCSSTVQGAAHCSSTVQGAVVLSLQNITSYSRACQSTPAWHGAPVAFSEPLRRPRRDMARAMDKEAHSHDHAMALHGAEELLESLGGVAPLRKPARVDKLIQEMGVVVLGSFCWCFLLIGQSHTWDLSAKQRTTPMPRKHVIAVVGPDLGSDTLLPLATEVGKLVAEAGYVLLTGGRNRGIMDAASKGAQARGDDVACMGVTST